MTIYEIKQRTQATSPYFFSRDTLKFFGQTLRMFRVYKQPEGNYLITCPMYDRSGKKVGQTERIFNPETNTLTLPENK